MAADRLRRAKQVDEKGDVMSGEKKNQERLFFAVSKAFGKSRGGGGLQEGWPAIHPTTACQAKTQNEQVVPALLR
jgi:hypothetical protein